ncbi:NAD(P)H-dependent glycerol-3-phosphate dehydrogenase [Asticcacaulis sp. YBE204]|uniref:NAD(P)H-dependent glycerol-3-phosphate dehydrogenase n=1 Tax=Asticcacaulis sp. YBE204 TaxID=1282363 RepID=UPI0003C3B3AD|nr:NAD(P)H-dependent glycerol-3-phosphate dehydrogenase [Asticcacaulis sp. YBE204]ESQ77784.1 glycerol-3-phosphate dehydrogenase [Asticcacaulis sp. YBE204]
MTQFQEAQPFQKVGVIGAGAWGTALAAVAARAGREVLLQCREPEVAESINSRHLNHLYLPNIELAPGLKATADLADLADCDLILAVPPAQHMRATLKAFAPYVADGLPIVLCAKGVERGSDCLMNEVLAATLPQARAAVLSGPSFAAEVARGLPTAVTLACKDDDLGARILKTIATTTFRPYLIDDMIGAEAGGALKNVLAIAAGISEGKGLGRSAHAALITRGFAEMTRLAVALGAEAETMGGLCGMGDLVLSCSSPQSRNMSVGLALGGGKTLAEALEGKISVAEGVESAPAVKHLGEKQGVELPICNMVATILSGEASVDEAIGELMSRPLKTER